MTPRCEEGAATAGSSADAIASAALGVPGVSALHGGSFGEVGTYLPGRRVKGVRTGPDLTEVHVVVNMGAPVLETAALIRAVVAPIVTTPVDVYVEDLDQSRPSEPASR